MSQFGEEEKIVF